MLASVFSTVLYHELYGHLTYLLFACVTGKCAYLCATIFPWLNVPVKERLLPSKVHFNNTESVTEMERMRQTMRGENEE